MRFLKKLTGRIIDRESASASARHQLALAISFIALLAMLYWSIVLIQSREQAFHFGNPELVDLKSLVLLAALCIFLSVFFLTHQFSFGYIVGFYFFIIVMIFLYVNRGSTLNYDHDTAFVATVFSLIAFLFFALRGAGTEPFDFSVPKKLFEYVPVGILLLACVTAIIASTYGFRLASNFNEMYQLRNSISLPTAFNYLIGNLIGGAIPFAYACAILKRKWLVAILLLAVSSLFFPITMSKLVLFEAAFLAYLTILVWLFEPRLATVLSIAILVAVGIGLEASGYGRGKSLFFQTVSFRMLAIPANSLEHYFAFFHDHPNTKFCQIWLLKPYINCPYSKGLGDALSDAYSIGNMNASLFATEGVASVGPVFMPLVAGAAGCIFWLGNKLTLGLPAALIVLSSATICQILSNVALTTTLLSNGLGLLFVLWAITPRDYFAPDLSP